MTTIVPTATSFYSADGARRIMTATSFPDEVFRYLQFEALVAAEAVKRYSADLLIELGCYDGRALDLASMTGIRYLGVDINSDGLELLEQRFAEHASHAHRAVHGDILQVEAADLIGAARRPLVLVPFNLLGNMVEPTELPRRFARPDVIIMTSTFRSSKAADTARRSYYEATGIAQIEATRGRFGGTVFSGEGFRSESFDDLTLVEQHRESGLTPLLTRMSTIGACVISVGAK